MRRKQKCGMAVAVWLVTLWALPAMASPIPSLPAREQMLGLLERQALHRDRVDWMTLRRDLAATGDPERQRRLLAEAINRATAGHGGWMSAGELRDRSRRTEHTAPVVPAVGAIAEPGGERIEARLGLVSVGPYLPDLGLPRGLQRDAERRHAQRLQDALWQQDDGSRCGWIVDLAENTGGNMWPMLLGVGPLLRGRVDGPDVVGHFFDGATLQPWRYREGAVWVATRRYWFRTMRLVACEGRMPRLRCSSPGVPPAQAKPSCLRCADVRPAEVSARRRWAIQPATFH